MAIKIILKCPLQVGELEVRELNLQRPKLKDFIAVGEHSADTAAAMCALAASISGYPENVIDQLDIEDASVLRITISRIWNSYFFTGKYDENPQAEAAGNPSP